MNTPSWPVSASANTLLPSEINSRALAQGLPVSMFSANTNTSSRELFTITSRSLRTTSVVVSSVLLLTVTAITPASAFPASGTSIALSNCWYLLYSGTLNSNVSSGSISAMSNCSTPRARCILRK